MKSSEIVKLLNASSIIAIISSGSHSLILKKDGTVWAWGRNNYGQLGNGTWDNSDVPVQVLGLTGITAIARGGYHSLALKNDGTVWAWGRNNYGQLGNGTWNRSNVPVQVSGLTGVMSIAGGEYHSLALKNDGTVWAWGYNPDGQLGNRTYSDSNVPVQVLGLTGVTAIAGGGYHSLALKSDGTVWAWGRNDYGQLGNGTNSDSNVPVQVANLTRVTAIAGGYGYRSLALKSDGTVWAWGYNYYGERGNGTTAASNVPVQVSGLTGVTAIAEGDLHSLALKSDGTIWIWGWTECGQLGDGACVDSKVPKQFWAHETNVNPLCNWSSQKSKSKEVKMSNSNSNSNTNKLYPRSGALAYNALGLLGLITSDKPEEVTYPDGKKDRAWIGICLVNDPDFYMPFGPEKGNKPIRIGDQWSSRCPVVVGYTDSLLADYPPTSGRKTTVAEWDREKGIITRLSVYKAAKDNATINIVENNHPTDADFWTVVRYYQDGPVTADCCGREKPYQGMQLVAAVAKDLGYPIRVAKLIVDKYGQH